MRRLEGYVRLVLTLPCFQPISITFKKFYDNILLPYLATALLLQLQCNKRLQSPATSIDPQQFQDSDTKMSPSCADLLLLLPNLLWSTSMYLSAMGYPVHGNLSWLALSEAQDVTS